MATLKDVQNKIQAVKKTKQITKAMNMVAASRLRGAQQNMDSFRPYADKFAEVLGSLAEKSGDDANPLLVPKEEVKKVHIILCTSDRGLCGGFNANLTAVAANFVNDTKDNGLEITFTCYGKKGRDFCRNTGYDIEEEILGVMGNEVDFARASETSKKIVEGFLDDTYDEVYVVLSEFISMAKQIPTLKQVLPIPPIETKEESTIGDDFNYLPEHICEPSTEGLFADMLPRNVSVQIHRALLETNTSEHAARMMAMDNATQACNDMLENLTLAYNKARQTAITAELMDIVGGAEALKG